MRFKGHEDASKILSNDAACPICDQVLSKSLMKPVDINPNEEWVNVRKILLGYLLQYNVAISKLIFINYFYISMAMAGISPQICILLT
uniref:Uncharacterized protein n=1 Tax=Lactuca sativa TaxID=4236 RepID=A0A9R1X228_LACSA|nr:hypothetical protein LSAT_V11C700382080 [Lactuca sativa]